MARNTEDILREKLEETRLEIDKQQAIRDSDRKTFKEREAAKRKLLSLTNQELALMEKIAAIDEKRNNLAESYADILQKEIRDLTKKLKEGKKLTDNEEELLNFATEYQKKLKENPALIKEATARYKELKNESEIYNAQLDSATQYVNDIEKNIRNLPIAGNFLANILMTEKAKFALSKKFAEFFEDPSLKRRFEVLSKNLGILVSGALIAISEEEWWKRVQRAFATTNDQITQYRDNIYRASVNSELELATRENLVEATNELSKVYGKLSLTDTKRLEDQVMLTKYLGLQGEEAAEIQRLGTIQGKDAEVVTQEIAAQVEGFNKLTGAGFVFNDIMKDVANSSDELKVIFNASAKELANGIIAVKGLGLELKDVQGVADGLLDIESSITNQVQAQILTGKKINLDKARQLAFENDLVGVAGELVKQGITSKDLTEGNRVGNIKLAESMGMSLDQLSKMVLEQEKFKELGVDISKGVLAMTNADRNRLEYLAAMGNETARQTIEQMKQATVQETLNKAMSDVKNIIAEIAIILLPALHVLANIVAFLAKYKTLIYGLIGFAAGGIGGAIGGAVLGAGMDIYDATTSMQPVMTPQPGITGASSYYKETVETKNVSVNTKETNDLLKQLINKVDQPVNLNIGDRAINQINNNIGLNRSYTPNVSRLS